MKRYTKKNEVQCIEDISLEIAHCVLTIHFHTFLKISEPSLYDSIKKFYAAFILRNAPKKSRVQMKIYNRESIPVLHYKGKSYLQHTELKDDVIITFNDISLYQFQVILYTYLVDALSSDAIFLHSSSILHEGRVYIFTGPSGAGKSTISQFLHKRCQLFADDEIIIRKINGEFLAFQFPNFERYKIYQHPQGYPIGQIFFLDKRKTCRLDNFSKKDEVIFEKLIQQINIQSTHEKNQIKNLFAFIRRNSFFNLGFPNDQKEVLDYFRRMKVF
jgi:hypothetical protein